MLKPNDHVLDYVDAYVHDVLPRHESRVVELHCRHCPICQVALEQAQKRLAAMHALPAPAVSDELLQKLEKRLALRKRPRLTKPQAVFAGLAAAALLIACCNLYFANASPSPYDLRLLGQSTLLAGSQGSLRVLVLNHSDSQPVANVPVTIELASSDGRQRVQLCKAATNRAGTIAPQIRWPEWQDGDYELRVTAKTGFTPERVTRGVRLERGWQVMLSSDKPIYQPGQTIQLRSLLLRRPNLLPVAGSEAVVSISDPKGNKIFRQRQVTSRFGIASTECPLADEITEGDYQIECQVGDTTGSLTVEVRKYVLPKFKLDLACDRPYYQPGQRIAGTVDANYFFGQPVAGAAVEFELHGSDAHATTLGTAQVKTDAAGKASFELPLPQSLAGRPQDSGDARVELVATVRDTAGQTQSKTVSRLVTANPIHIEVLPEMGNLVQGLSNRIYLITSYPDGRPAKTRIAVSRIDRELVTDELGATSFDAVPGPMGLDCLIRATDDAGLTGTRALKLGAGELNDDFLIRAEKAVFTAGETLHAVALGGGPEPVFVDLVRGGQTIVTQTMEMSEGTGRFEFDLPAELFGPIELVAYRYDPSGLPIRKTRVVYVRPARSVQIATKLDQAEYRPGERARLTFTLSDETGKPAPGALSLAAVDEAVFSVDRPAVGMQTTLAALEAELLEPVWAIYPWSPDLWSQPGKQAVPADERNRFEQALFSAAARRHNVDVERELVPFMDNDASAFRALERPDWEELAEGVQMPPGTIAKLRERNAPYSLSADSFQAQLLSFERWQRGGLQATYIAWFVLFVVTLAALLAAITRVRFGVAAAAVLAAMCLIALLLPAIQQVREASRRYEAMAELKQLASAALQHEDRHFALGDADDLIVLRGTSMPAPRLRQWFPETLLWRPELITDERGHATLEVDLADSITSWRLSASAITVGGKLAAAEESIRVFQPFFVDFDLPVALTRGDEATVPVVVYNYLDQPQTVELTLADQPALALLDEATQKIELAPREVRAAHFRLRAAQVGRPTLEVRATAGTVADAVRRTIEIVPDGQRVEQVVSGNLQPAAAVDVTIPESAVPGSARTLVKIYPSSFSQLVEGLDAIFQRPYGCFEQTSSTTYPNVLALDYLRRTKQNVPAVEAKARGYIHLGCQRLLSFEVAGGGFDWFGNPPANRTLSAYGLLEFADMAKVHSFDSAVIERTRQWLLTQQRVDGSWDPEMHALHDDPTRRGDMDRLATTAYVAWAVFAGQPGGTSSPRTLSYLRSHRPESITNPYVLALVAQAISVLNGSPAEAAEYLDRLDSLKRTSGDGRLAWWEMDGRDRTQFYGSGGSGDVETTALASLALIESGRHPDTVRGALAWLVEQKGPQGLWPSTQATVLALKALCAGTGKALGERQDRQIEIAIDGQVVEQATIPAEQFDVVRQIDLSDRLGVGSHRVSITGRGEAPSAYQVLAWHYLPEPAAAPTDQSLSITLVYDRTMLAVGDSVAVSAAIVNHMPVAAPMVLVDLPIPPGFAPDVDSFDALLTAGSIAKYQLTTRSVIVYLRSLPAGEALSLAYRLKSTMPVKVSAPAAIAYEYYNPDRRATSGATQLTVELQ